MNSLTKYTVVVLVLITSILFAQGNKQLQELKIKTSAVCDMCQRTLEKAMAYEKGVKKSSLDVDSKILTVTYNPNKTTPDKIRIAVTEAGYDADSLMANPRAYDRLDNCCKKGAHQK